jgi:uncharacterized membrane protein HdeD (DUF308 family)
VNARRDRAAMAALHTVTVLVFALFLNIITGILAFAHELADTKGLLIALVGLVCLPGVSALIGWFTYRNEDR